MIALTAAAMFDTEFGSAIEIRERAPGERTENERQLTKMVLSRERGGLLSWRQVSNDSKGEKPQEKRFPRFVTY